MPVNLATGYTRTTGEPIDVVYLTNTLTSYSSVLAANSAITPTIRYIGQFVNINNQLYWYKSGILDSDLILFNQETSPLTTKGDIYVRNGSDNTRLPVGLDTQILISDSSTPTGLKWSSNTTPPPSGYYGAWHDNQTQTAALSNTGYAIIFRTVDLSNGITVVTNGINLTRITFANTGIYNFQFSAQFQNTDNIQHDINIWLRLNGSDVANSNGVISIPARKSSGIGDEGHVIAGWNYVLNVVAGQYYELMWMTDNADNVTMKYYAANNSLPSTASVILTITQQSGIMAGTGITAINSLTDSAQTLVTGTSGTNFEIISNGTTHTFNLPTASSINRGALSNLDWITFNNKQSALSGTGFVKISGTTISYDNSEYYLSSNPNNYIALTALSSLATGLTYTNTTGIFSLTSGYAIPTTTKQSNWDTAYTNRITSASAPLSITSNALSISQANTTTNGFLSSTDWNTFNSKQNTISLTTTGNSGAATFSSNTLNIPTYTLAGLGGFTNPMTTLGDVIYGDTSGVATRLAGNTTTTKNVLLSTGNGTSALAPIWGTLTASDVGAQASSTNLTSLAGLSFTSTSFVKMTAAGTFALDTNTYYLASNPSGYTNNTGTVTSVSVATANGVSGTVATNTTTPAITLTLGSITPTSVNGLTFTAAATGFTIAGGTTSKTLTVSNTLRLAGTDTSTLNIGSGGTLGSAAFTASTAYQSSSTNLTSLAGLTFASTSFVKMTAAGTFALDTNTYLTSISGISAGGELTGTYANPSLLNSAVIGKVLTGLTISGSTISATDSILTAFGKLQNQVNNLVGGTIYKGTWNASTNTPTLASGVGTSGNYYIVNVAGSTTLDGISDWKVGDWAIFQGTTWQKVDNTDAVTSVNGQTGAVSLTTSNISEGTNLYYTDARARASLSSTATGLTYTSGTGVFSLTTGYSIPTTASQSNWDTAYTQTRQWDGGATGLVPATGRTSLGATTVGSSLFTLTNPSIISFLRINADNSVSALNQTDFQTAIGASASATANTLVLRDGAGSFLATNGGFSGQMAITRAWDAALFKGQLYLGGATGNRIDWTPAGLAAPATTTRSVGTKLNFYPAVSATNVDYAVGLETDNMWHSVPSTTQGFKWYFGTSNLATLTNTSFTAPSFVKSGGTSSQFLKADGSVDATSYLSTSGGTMSGNITFASGQTWPVWTILQGGTGAQTASGARTNLGLGSAAILDAGVANGVATLDGSGVIPLSQIPSSLQGALQYIGTWNAAANTPTLTSSVGIKGYYYVVNVAGSTTLNGINDWAIGDWAIFNGSVWQKIDNTDAVSSVNGFTGAVTLTTSNINESGNLYYTDTRARNSISSTATGLTYTNGTGVFSLTSGYSIPTTASQGNWDIAYTNRITSLTTTGNSGAATLTNNVLNIPNYTLAGLGGLTNPMTAVGDMIYGGTVTSGIAAVTRLAGSTSASKVFLSQTGTGTISAAPAWSSISGSDVTGAALTTTNDNNVTLTLGGTPSTALLRAASITAGWTGQLSISRGGTNATTAADARSNLGAFGGVSTDLNTGSSNFAWVHTQLPTTITNMDALQGTGATAYSRASTFEGVTNGPFGNQWYSILNMQHRGGSDVGVADGQNWGTLLAFGLTANTTRAAFRTKSNSSFLAWRELVTTTIGSGTANNIPKFSGAGALTGSGITDNGSTITLSTNSNTALTIDGNQTPTFTSGASTGAPTIFLNQGSNPYSFIATSDQYHGIILRGVPAAAATYGVTVGDQMSFVEFGGVFNFYKKTNTPELTLQATINNGNLTTTGDIISGANKVIRQNQNYTSSSPTLQVGDNGYGFSALNSTLYFYSGTTGFVFRNNARNADIASIDNSGNISAAGNININGGAAKGLYFASGSYAIPSTGSRSIGTKIVLWPDLSSTNVDYAIGISSGTLWNSVPNSGGAFRWYAGTNIVATLNGSGQFSAPNVDASSNLSYNGTLYAGGRAEFGGYNYGNGRINMLPSSDGSTKFIDFWSNNQAAQVGSISTNGTNTFFNNSSDYRLKENVVPVDSAVDKIMRMKPSNYNFIGHTEKMDGFIAHELQEVIPYAVTGVKDAVYKDGSINSQQVDYSKLTPILVAALQELIKENVDLKKRIENLENK